MMRLALGLTLLAIPGSAWAGTCDTQAAAAATAKGPALVEAFKGLLACDKGEAEAAYLDFLTATGDVDTMIGLSIAAIDGKAYAPVWNSLDKIKDYSMRDKAAQGIGESCKEHAEVVVFLKGAYFGLKDIQFAQWDDAYVACPSADVDGWLEGLVAKPPERSYDEKYNTILQIWVKRKGKDALGKLQEGAVKASGNGGPFNTILEAMDQAVQPTELGAEMSDADRKLLEASLVAVAGQTDAKMASAVADRLFNAGAEAAAASLLPKVYPDRVQAGGGLMYGVASIEACDKQAIIHYAAATEPAKRWSIIGDIEAPARAFKAKLKCTADGPWPVVATPEPVADVKAIEAWVADLESQWAGKGNEVKLKAESDIVLQ